MSLLEIWDELIAEDRPTCKAIKGISEPLKPLKPIEPIKVKKQGKKRGKYKPACK